MSKVSRFNNYLKNLNIENNSIYDLKFKNENIINHIDYTLIRTSSMFKYKNLPLNIPSFILELYLQLNGHCIFTEYENEYYIFNGSFSGLPNEYHLPKEYIVSNPYLKLNKTYQLNNDCVLIKNDSLAKGISDLIFKYSTELSETELSLNVANINTRLISLISSSDDNTFESAKKLLEDVENGKIGCILDDSLVNSINVQPYSNYNSNYITSLIELLQYYKASLFNELGLNSNYNMKRESINSNESQLNDDMLHPLVDDMLNNRKQALYLINSMYDLDIQVEFNSSWKKDLKEDEEMKENGDNANE